MRPPSPVQPDPRNPLASNDRLTKGTLPLHFFILLAWVLPWINPFAPGPGDAVEQALLSVVALSVLLMALPRVAPDPGALARVLAGSLLLAALLNVGIGVVQYAADPARWTPWVNVAPPGTVYGNLRQRNQFASLCSLGLVALLFLAPGPGRGGWRVAAMVAAMFLGLGNGLSASRTGLLEGLVLLGLYGLVWHRQRTPERTRLMLAAFGGFVLAVWGLPWLGLADPGLLSRLSLEPGGCGGRMTLWSNVLYLIAQQPITGWGWGGLIHAQFITLVPAGARYCGMLDDAHNMVLHLAVEFGVPAALLVCGYLLWRTLRARPWSQADARRQWAWAGLAVMGLHSLLEYPLRYGPFLLAALGCVAVLVWTGVQAPEAVARWQRLARWRLPAGALLLGVAALGAYSYAEVQRFFPSGGQRLAPFPEGYMAAQPRPPMFGRWLDFAEVANTPVTPSNAAHTLELAEKVVAWRPVPAVIEPLVRSAVLSQRHDLALAYLQRYQAAYPEDHAEWVRLNARP